MKKIMHNVSEELNEKIRQFGRKYQLNKLYKGAIIFVFISVLTFLIYVALEYFSYFTPPVRTILFYTYLFAFVETLVRLVIIPLCRYFGLGKQLSNEQIAKMIGTYFPEIDDKLLNLLQLQQQVERGDYESYDLLLRAIETKAEKLTLFPFVKAIPFHKTRKYLKWAFIPLIIFVLIFSIKSEVITEPTRRIVNYSEYYEKPAPYSIVLGNDKLLAFQHDDYKLDIKIEGEELPQELYIVYNKKNYKCVKESNSSFSYTFANLQQTVDFQIYTDEVSSKLFKLQVLPKPLTIGFAMKLHYPSYLNKNDEILDNVGTASVPEGTSIIWQFYTKTLKISVFCFKIKIRFLPHPTIIFPWQ